MKKILGTFIIFLFTVINSIAQPSSLYIRGSETVLPLSIKYSKTFMDMHPGFTIEVVGGGSGVGINALIEGNTDIAEASRKIKPEELAKLKDENRTVKEVEIAFDALAVIVNPQNPVKNLTREQLEAIFTGKISNWKELGGNNLSIVVYSRESSSGTYVFFKEHVLKNKDYSPSSMIMPSMDALTIGVAQTPGGIGYIGLAYCNKDTKTINVSFDGGKNYIEPSVSTVNQKTYPIIRSLYYYYDIKDESKVKDFIELALSPIGQQIVKEVGYIPLTAK